jgi:phage nucleotide-binding protein
MPKVSKQARPVKKKVARTNNKPTGTVWDRITAVGETDSHIRMVVYGKSGTGKTRFSCTFPKPLLLIETEVTEGTKSIVGDKGVDFITLNTTDELPVLIEGLTDSKYKSVVLDTATMLQDLVLKEILGLEELPVQKSWGMASRDQYGQCGIKVKEYMRALLNLPMHVIVTAQERDFNSEDSSGVLDPSMGPALTPGVTSWLCPAVDYLCQTFIKQRTITKRMKVGDKEHETEVKTQDVDFCLRTMPHEVYMVKFRLPRGKQLPQLIVDPSYGKVAKLLQTGA